MEKRGCREQRVCVPACARVHTQHRRLQIKQTLEGGERGSCEQMGRNRQRQPRVQGPRAGSEPAVLRSSKDASVAAAEWATGGREVREGLQAVESDCWRPSGGMT